MGLFHDPLLAAPNAMDLPVLHPAIPLLDEAGNHVLDSGKPYSPRLRRDGALSCGSCHTPHGQAQEGQVMLRTVHGNPWLRVPNRDSASASSAMPRNPPPVRCTGRPTNRECPQQLSAPAGRKGQFLC